MLLQLAGLATAVPAPSQLATAVPSSYHFGSLIPVNFSLTLSTSSSTWWTGHEDELVRCRPKDDALWFIGADHKTGTVLLLSFFQQVMALAESSALIYDLSLPGEDSQAKQQCEAEESPFGPSCLFGAASKGGIVMATHAAQHIPGRQSWIDAYRGHRTNRTHLRLAYSSRKPLEVIRSSYLYHVDCPEPWCADRSGSDIQAFRHDMVAACDPERCIGCVPLDQSVCSHAAFRTISPDAPLSYQELLQKFPARVGIMVEAWHMLDQLQDMREALSTLEGDQSAVTVDLDTIMGSGCQAEMTRMFQSLDSYGSPAACARLACADAIEGSSGSHSTSDAPEALTEMLLQHLGESEWVRNWLKATNTQRS